MTSRRRVCKNKRKRPPSVDNFSSGLLSLPPEILLCIVTLLDLASKGRFASVCSTFRAFMYCDSVWRSELLRRWDPAVAERYNAEVFRASRCVRFLVRELELQSRPFRPRGAEMLERLASLDALRWSPVPKRPLAGAELCFFIDKSPTDERPTVLGIRCRVLIDAPVDVVAGVLLDNEHVAEWNRSVCRSRCVKYIENGLNVVEKHLPPGPFVMLRTHKWEGSTFMLAQSSQFPRGLRGIDGTELVGGSQPLSWAQSMLATFCPLIGSWDLLPSGFVATPEFDGASCMVTFTFIVDLKQPVQQSDVCKACSVNSGIIACLKRVCEMKHAEQLAAMLQPQEKQQAQSKCGGCPLRFFEWLRTQWRACKNK